MYKDVKWITKEGNNKHAVESIYTLEFLNAELSSRSEAPVKLHAVQVGTLPAAGSKSPPALTQLCWDGAECGTEGRSALTWELGKETCFWVEVFFT